ncbi:MAG: hypothetical protein RLZZ540_2813 [Bacteroidota bacterium]|jgi:DUF1680 family protein
MLDWEVMPILIGLKCQNKTDKMKKNSLHKIVLNMTIVSLLLVSITAIGQSHYPGQHSDKIKVQDKAVIQLSAFDLQNVKLLDSPFKENMKRESNWILSLKVKSLLHSFRNNAGVYAGNEGGYFVTPKLGGWESLDCDLRGHSTGHIMSGLALLYATTGDEIYKIKSDSIVNGLAEVQKVLNQGGYLSAYPQNLIDRSIAGQSVWAPWYTLHKILSGLIDQYLYCNNTTALETSKGMSAWAYSKLSPLTKEQRIVMLRNEFGGINDSFYNLYAITGNPKDKFLAEFFYHEAVLDPLLKEEDILDKKHANTYIPKLIGITRGYELEGNKDYEKSAKFFWNTVVDHHSFITGSNSDKEKFFKPDHISEHLTGYTGESCNVYNMLKLTRHLFAYSPNSKYADYYEKALYNHILGQQDTISGNVAYFLPMLPGAHKVYSTKENSFWCCVGSGFENQAKYGEFIYYHNANELYVNLFIPSELNWKEKGIKVKQETTFPESDKTVLTISAASSTKMTINIRYPEWATSGVTIKINGKAIKVKKAANGYIPIERNWNDGDRIELMMPMELKSNPTADNPNVVAFTYGPIVLAGRMGTEGMQAPAPFTNTKLYNDYYTFDYHIPNSLSNKLDMKSGNINTYIKPIQEQPLNFKLVNEGIELAPIYKIHRERYSIYWDISKKK